MSDTRIRDALNLRLSRTPEILFHPKWWLKCTVKILIVTDSSSGGYGPTASFHLGQILNVLADDPWSHVTFVVTKAHRQTDGTADLENFRFHTHDLSQYSQVWLFGIERTTGPLSEPELKALTQFMDAGGGVFATGDHENLGQAMCAEVPRVRSMRRWHWPNPGPGGEPVAPDQTGAERHDTVVDIDAATPGLQGDQSDKVPQPILPTWYTRKVGSGIIHKVHQFPHPVLCGPDGVIKFLPDHMHEGLCEVPPDLGKSFTFDGFTSAEYPTAGGHQESPQVIARATTRNTDNDEFGVLAAYDGHRAGVGRVVVDATWHHWFNINLVGFVNATDPALPGFDPGVVPKWEAIKAYFRNVGVWLARPSLQNCLRNGGWLIASKYSDILITYRDLRVVPNKLQYFWQLGVFAKDALGRFASQCQTTRWVIEAIEWIDFRIDPWRLPGKPPLPDPPPWLDLEELETVALGGGVHALLDAFGKEDDAQTVLDRAGDRIPAVARRGAAVAVTEWAKHYQEASRDAARLAERAGALSRPEQ